MATPARLLSRAPGRLRFRIPSKKGDSPYFGALETECAKLSGLKSVEVNPSTASLLLFFDPALGLSSGAIADDLDLELAPSDRMPLEKRVSRQVGLVDSTLKRLTGGELDLGGIAFLGCLAAGVYQVGIGNVAMPAWFVAFWYAMNLASGKQS